MAENEQRPVGYYFQQGVTRKKTRSRGPHSIFLRRSSHGFGFTLRHFIVYPPESYLVLQDEPGADHLAVPIDTIFVKNVRVGGPAHVAGLATGDRIIAVNGQSTTGYTYAEVVQLIQNSGNYLQLLVVPKEDDLLQRHFADAAHNPETNQRPCWKSPDINDHLVSYGIPKPCLSSVDPNFRNTKQDRGVGNKMTFCCDKEIHKHIMSEDFNRRDSSISLPCSSSNLDSKESLSSESTSTLTGYPEGYSSEDSLILSRIRKSFEQKEEFLRRPNQPIIWDTSNDYSLRNEQIVKAREFYARPQKFQRLLWPPQLSSSQGDVSYRPQSPVKSVANGKPMHETVIHMKSDVKFDKDFPSSELSSRENVFDRASSEPRDSENERNKKSQFVYGRSESDVSQFSINHHPDQKNSHTYQNSVKCINNKTPFVTKLTRIHENLPSVDVANSHVHSNNISDESFVNQGSCSENLQSSSFVFSPGDDRNKYVDYSRLHLVSRRAKQFETGQPEEDESGTPLSDRTSLYRSELARLSSKKSVPDVATRRQEFESRSAVTRDLRRTSRESRSLESAETTGESPSPGNLSENLSGNLSGNRLIPIGSKHLHCEPPTDFKQQYSEPPRAIGELSAREKLRARSNSAESWAAAKSARSAGEWNRINLEENGRHKAVRQDSYLAAVSSPFVSVKNVVPELSPETEDKENKEEKEVSEQPVISPSAVRPTVLCLSNITRPSVIVTDISGAESEVPGPNDRHDVVLRRREGSNDLSEEERLVRRVSYLKATLGDRIHVDSDLDISDTEAGIVSPKSKVKKWQPPPFPDDIQRIVKLFDSSASPLSKRRSSSLRPDSNKENQQLQREGWLHCKFTLVDGKKAGDRSWKMVWAVLKSSELQLYRDRRDSQNLQSPPGTNDDYISMDMRDTRVDIAGDYTKRKNVFRLTNAASCTELLLQAEDTLDMAQWIKVLQQSQASANTSEECSVSSADEGSRIPSSGIVSKLSPLPSHKGIKKLTSFRTRSPTGQSPVNKTRKPSQSDQLPSPKTKTWKGRVAKQFRRIQQGGGSPSSPTAPYPEGATIGIPLEDCPMSSLYESVPCLVHLCTSIVEERGLDIIGIYRVPGNTAAVSSLTEAINKGIDSVKLEIVQDSRWSDVNVISSLLKLFFRRLPDSLFTSELYPHFIEADKVEDPVNRIIAIKKLIHDLPEHHFETLKFLLFHLKKVVAHCEKNKMEARNLAIVFGPTLVRAGDDNMITMVTDMSHQCRIIESLITHVDWFFSDDDSDECFSPGMPDDVGEPEPATANHDLLLGNIRKVEGLKAESPSKDISAKDIVSSIISAANRKMQKAKSKKGLLSPPVLPPDDVKNITPEITKHSNNKTKDIQSLLDNQHSVGDEEETKTKSEAAEMGDVHLQSVKQEIEKKDNDPFNWTYAGLSATTQERIRRFERETKAMLRQDPGKQRLDSERLKLDTETQHSRMSVASEDCFHTNTFSSDVVRRESGSSDGRPSSCLSFTPPHSDPRPTDRNSFANDSNTQQNTRSSFSPQAMQVLRSPGLRNSLPGITSSIRESQLPKMPLFDNCKNVTTHSNSNSKQDLPQENKEIHQNGVMAERSPNILKRLKTSETQQPGLSHLQPLGTFHCGSLDSLQDIGRPHSDISDDGSDLLASLTTTFDRKLKSLLAPSANTSVDNSSDATDNSVVSEAAGMYRDPSLHRGRSPTREKLETDLTETVVTRKLDSHHVSRTRERKNKDNTSSQKGGDESTSDNKTHKTETSNCVKMGNGQSVIRSGTTEDNGSNVNSLKCCDNNVDKSDFSKSGSAKYPEAGSSDISKLKRFDVLTKDEKTESNIGRQKQELLLLYDTRTKVNIKEKENIASVLMKLKRKNGMPERSIKRRHTVGGTKDFDKLNWLDNRIQQEQLDNKFSKEHKPLRTSSPDLSCTRLLRPQSLPDPNLVSRVFKVPLESHV